MNVRLIYCTTAIAAAVLVGCVGMPTPSPTPTPSPSPSPTPTPDPQTMAFVATLDGDQEVPPVQTNGSGTATFTFDPATNELTYDIEFGGLSGPVTVAHFHNEAVGVSGGVVFDISADFAGGAMMVSGTWPMTAQDVSELMDGRIYVNIHTELNPAGEIRGQLTPAP